MNFKTLLSISLLSMTSLSLPVTANVTTVQTTQIKQDLINKLDLFQGFSSKFKQSVVDVQGNILQETTGKLIVKRPNLIYWETEQPDETLVISDGSTLWFYNPFVEQVSAFSVVNSVANTPILLLSDTRLETWQEYRVNKISNNSYSIISLNSEAQVKSLDLVFADDKIRAFSIVDATGQVSKFNLSNVDTRIPDNQIFKFTLPEGVDLDDQR